MTHIVSTRPELKKDFRAALAPMRAAAAWGIPVVTIPATSSDAVTQLRSRRQ
jgi:hypothetical protein